MQPNFTEILKQVADYASSIGLNVIDKKFDGFFKGDMNGTDIWIDFAEDDENELFNLLHMIGHCVQWGLSEELLELGSVLHPNPDDAMLHKLQKYEWEANCYAQFILHTLGIYELDRWLFNKYYLDMHYLTHFYVTGDKVKKITPTSTMYAYTKALIPKVIPKFTPVKIDTTRSGIVINFDN